jgi:hypothetical protein
MSSLPSTPSPSQATSPLAAYRGRRAPTGRASFLPLFSSQPEIYDLFNYLNLTFFSLLGGMIGALDGSLLARLAQGESDSDADE